jgi:tripartite-type tricarboxylate transporter receptor subunit TctC
MQKMSFLLAGVLILTFIPCITFGATPFYEGKTIRIIVGVSAGGAFDHYARILSRHMGKYIPGKPTIIVENMTGAGGLIAANYLYKIAKPDGLTIAHFNGGLLFSQALEQPGIEFDARKFEYLGAISKENGVLFLTKTSGITNIDQLMAAKTPVKLGGVGVGSYAPDGIIRILKATVGLPLQLVAPYKGGADIRLAAEGGELAGSILAWDAIKMAWSTRLESGQAFVVLQAVPKPLRDLPNVPLAISLAKTEEARQLIDLYVHNNNTFSRLFVLGPGVPKDREEILRKAFQETLKDKEFMEEASKARLGIDPVTGEEIEKAVEGIFKMDSTTINKLKDILYK